MGQEIVYCEGCGISLREADFAKGKAWEVDHRPYCSSCAPARPPPPEPAHPSKKASSGHLQALQGTPRRAMPTLRESKRAPSSMVIGGVVGGVVLLVVLVAISTSGGSPASRPAEAPPRTVRELAREPGERGVPPPSRKSEEEPRQLASGAKDLDTLRDPTEAEKAAKLDTFLAQIRARIAEDPGFQRRAEVERMMAAAEKSAGARGAEVSQLRAGYEKAREDAVGAATDAARREAESLWSQNKFTEAVQRARTIPEAFRGTKRAEELNAFADDLERKMAEAQDKSRQEVEKRRQEALGAWKVWKVESGSFPEKAPKVLDSYAGRQNVFETHPLSPEKPASLERTVEIPAGKKTALSFFVAPHQKGDWEVRVLADGKLLHKQEVTPANSGWKPVKVDLTPFAGKKILLRLENAATGWSFEYGFWSDIEMKSE